MIFYFLIIAIALILLGIIFYLITIRKGLKLGSLRNSIIYQDNLTHPGETLTAQSLPLRGKPDYLKKTADNVIPIEYKNCKTPHHPYQNHVMQLMAYCLLEEENYQKTPPYGVLKYPDTEFKIEYTFNLKQELTQLIEEIYQAKLENTEFYCDHPNHNL